VVVCLEVLRDDAAEEALDEAPVSPLTRPARDAVAAATVPGLMGETGRANPDFPGDALTGD
jgi:hypothetical protein